MRGHEKCRLVERYLLFWPGQQLPEPLGRVHMPRLPGGSRSGTAAQPVKRGWATAIDATDEVVVPIWVVAVATNVFVITDW